jgi:hypothetical protein
MKAALRVAVSLFLFVAVMIISGGCAEDKTLSPEEQTVRILDMGWGHFESGDYGMAESVFADLLRISVTHAEGRLGYGWSLLMSGNPANAQVILSTAAAAGGVTYLDARAGMALANDALGRFDKTITSAQVVLSTDSTYVFLHATQVDWRDLCYVLSKAYLLESEQADPGLRLSVRYLRRIDGQTPLIRADDPETWVSNGVTYETLAEAVLKRLEFLQSGITGGIHTQ